MIGKRFSQLDESLRAKMHFRGAASGYSSWLEYTELICSTTSNGVDWKNIFSHLEAAVCKIFISEQTLGKWRWLDLKGKNVRRN
jgi:hypothetical protein